MKRWASNLRADLESDSVAAPGSLDRKWLLFQNEDMQIAADGDSIACWLCRKCAASLSKRSLCAQERPAAKMPELARANGLWGGPQPEVIRSLSYAESKVIQLARLYVSVKRVFLTGGSSMRPCEVPKYHSKNVVAYPQHLDAVLRTLGLRPVELAQTILVQFVGSDRGRLRHEPSLEVDLHRLRLAFQWLLANSWLWMQATKTEVVGVESLGYSLESLLQAYNGSIGSSRGVPAELLQAAQEISAEHARVSQAGPADVNADDEDQSVNEPGEEQDESGAVLDGGTSDISGIQLWDTIMKKYGVHR